MGASQRHNGKSNGRDEESIRVWKNSSSCGGHVGISVVPLLRNAQLYDHIHDVLRKLISVESQVGLNDGRRYRVRNNNAVASIDITSAKKLKEEPRIEIAELKK
jgi:hypothetical protein